VYPHRAAEGRRHGSAKVDELRRRNALYAHMSARMLVCAYRDAPGRFGVPDDVSLQRRLRLHCSAQRKPLLPRLCCLKLLGLLPLGGGCIRCGLSASFPHRSQFLSPLGSAGSRRRSCSCRARSASRRDRVSDIVRQVRGRIHIECVNDDGRRMGAWRRDGVINVRTRMGSAGRWQSIAVVCAAVTGADWLQLLLGQLLQLDGVEVAARVRRVDECV